MLKYGSTLLPFYANDRDSSLDLPACVLSKHLTLSPVCVLSEIRFVVCFLRDSICF